MGINVNIFASVFGFWPLLFLAILVGFIRARGRFYKALKLSVRTMIVIWGAFALLRAYSFALHFPVKTYYISDPLNTRLFFFTGFLLFGLQLLVIFVYKRYERIDIYKVHTIEGLLKLPAQDLLVEIGAYFRFLGHKTKVNDPAKDGRVGNLLIKTKLKRNWIVQFVHSSQPAVEHQLVDLLDRMDINAADLGVLISTTGFSPSLVQLVKYQPVKLLDGSHLLKMFQRLHILKIRSYAEPSDSRADDKLPENENNSASKQVLQA